MQLLACHASSPAATQRLKLSICAFRSLLVMYVKHVRVELVLVMCASYMQVELESMQLPCRTWLPSRFCSWVPRFLSAVAGVIRRMGVSQHCFILPLDLLLQHGRPVLPIVQDHVPVWKQWQVSFATASKQSMQLDIDTTRVETIPQLLATSHAQDSGNGFVAQPYAARTDLSHVKVNHLSCVRPRCCETSAAHH